MVLAAGLAAAQPPADPAGSTLAPLVGDGGEPPPPWRVAPLRRQRMPVTRFAVVALGGERVLRVEAERSYGNLVHPVDARAVSARTLSWRWRVDRPLAEADLSRRATDDMALRVCAMFDLPLASVPFLERQLLRALRTGAEDDPPGATLCYVWDARLAPGTLIASAYTRRLRFVVLRGPESPLAAWFAERRDLRADFLAAFGDETKEAPPLLAIGVGADADNTGGHSIAHAADLVLR